MGHPPTGRRFHDVDEIYIFRVSGGKLAGASGVEDNVRRMPNSASARDVGLPKAEHRTPIRARDRWLSGLLVPPCRTVGLRARPEPSADHPS
jgi:hypothetical protein